MEKRKHTLNNLCEEKGDVDNSKDTNFFLPSNDSVCLDIKLKDRFKVLLSRIGRSQNWLADEVGVSRGTMSKIINGFWFPQHQVIIRICEILQIDSVYLFGDNLAWKHWTDKMLYQDKEGER